MDLSLTDEQAAMWDLAKSFIDREVVPHAAQWDRAEAGRPLDRRTSSARSASSA